MNIRRWKEKWPHLDLLRDCTASSDSCWLCDDLQEWNAVLDTFLIDLHEPQPGKICLAIIPGSPSTYRNDPHDTAFLTVWLLRKHRCIETLELYESGPLKKVAVPKDVARFVTNLRHVSIEGGAPANWCRLLDAIGPIYRLESLRLVGFDVNYALAAKLDELLSANANSVRKVHIVGLFTDSRISDDLMRGISNCRNLRYLGVFCGLGPRGREGLALCLRFNTTLEKFCLNHDQDVEEAFCDFMRPNMTLKELTYWCRCDGRIQDVLRAVEKDHVLEHLAVKCAVQSLCEALTQNTCSVKFGSLEASPLEREALARTLNENNLYGRVQLNWTDYDAEGLAASLLLQPPQRLVDLELNTGDLSDASFASVCKALSSSHRVSSLKVHLSRVTPECVDSLCEALKKNVTLQHVKLVEGLGVSGGSAVRVAMGLRSNLSVWHLEMKCISVGAVEAELLKSLVLESQRLNLIDLSLKLAELTPHCMDILSRGMVENRFINSFHISFVQQGADQTAFNDALMRNSVCLNHAVRFALRRNTGKMCAEAFELFEAQTSLVARVESAAGMSETEAKAVVQAAKHFISDHYFIINQVVRDKLECLPGEGTQIDQLNPACWRHIMGYLKVADVIVQ
ncbi:hypothetical protein HPB48_008704 [Haemaphysalis longicornis]|uniref:Ran gtpase-activating protein n=1 Tax=Haemaphysalis longicornis TaxID=44386 RepID=A0A9J6H0G3_HAELO|nr:hypothetical protein HPB48_008704 [Haemaphysalis longicornis]